MIAKGTDAVAVVTAEVDADAGRVLITRLAEYGVVAGPAGDSKTDAERAVVLLSAAALGDGEWLAQVDRFKRARTVPVRLGDVRAQDVPDALGELHWIVWPGQDAAANAAPMAEIFTALHSDLSRYQVHRSLTVEALTWDAAGRPDFLLIDSGPKARLAAVHVRDAKQDRLSAPTAVMEDFVAASMKLARREWRRKARRWAYRATIAAMVAVLGIFVVVSLRVAGKSSDLEALGGAMQWWIQERPDRIGMLSAGVLAQPGYTNRELARRTVVDVLGRQWSQGVLGSAHTSRLLDAVMTADGNHTVTFDGEGSLTAWDNRSAAVVWRRELGSAGPTGVLDGDLGQNMVVIASNETLYVVQVDPWQELRRVLPARATDVALASASRYAAVENDDGTVLIVPLGDGPIVPSPLHGKVLDMTRTADGEVRALVRDGPDLFVGDPRSGAVFVRQKRPEHRFEKASLGVDGSVAWTGPDRQIYYAPEGLQFLPTGQAVPDQLEVLEVLPRGRLAYGGFQFGVMLYDDSVGAAVGEICRTLVGVGQLVVSPGGDTVACLDYYHVDLWRTFILSPLAEPPALTSGLGDTQSESNSNVRITGSDAGRVEFAFQPDEEGVSGLTTSIQIDGAVTAVAASPDGTWVAVGTRDGEVVQYERNDQALLEVGHWTASDGAPVTMLGLDPSNTNRMLVQTGGNRWWSPRACTGCVSDAVLINRVRSRLWGCYTENQVERLTDETRALFGIRVCAASPKVGG